MDVHCALIVTILLCNFAYSAGQKSENIHQPHSMNTDLTPDITGAHLGLNDTELCNKTRARFRATLHAITQTSISVEWVVCRAFEQIHGFRAYWRRVGIESPDAWTKSRPLHEDIRHYTVDGLNPGTVYEVCIVERLIDGSEGSPRLEKCGEAITETKIIVVLASLAGVFGVLAIVLAIAICCILKFNKEKVHRERAKAKIEVSRPIQSSGYLSGGSDWHSTRTQSDFIPEGAESQHVSNVSGYSQNSQLSTKSNKSYPKVPLPQVPDRNDSFFNTGGTPTRSRRRNDYDHKPPLPTSLPPDDIPSHPRGSGPPSYYDSRQPAPLPKEVILNPRHLTNTNESDKYVPMDPVTSLPQAPVPVSRNIAPHKSTVPFIEQGVFDDEYLRPSDAKEEHVYHYIPYESISGDVSNTAL